jgi:hypothetical protein
VIAKKVQALTDLGLLNSRLKDFFDQRQNAQEWLQLCKWIDPNVANLIGL